MITPFHTPPILRHMSMLETRQVVTRRRRYIAMETSKTIETREKRCRSTCMACFTEMITPRHDNISNLLGFYRCRYALADKADSMDLFEDCMRLWSRGYQRQSGKPTGDSLPIRTNKHSSKVDTLFQLLYNWLFWQFHSYDSLVDEYSIIHGKIKFSFIFDFRDITRNKRNLDGKYIFNLKTFQVEIFHQRINYEFQISRKTPPFSDKSPDIWRANAHSRYQM